jgi:hypothetical protein
MSAKRPARTRQVPATVDEQTEPLERIELRRVISAAGLTPEEVADMVRAALKKLLAKMEAKKTQFFSFEGLVREERTAPDHDAQLKAVRELRQLLEMLAPKIPESQPTVPVQINVVVPWSAQPPGPGDGGGARPARGGGGSGLAM